MTHSYIILTSLLFRLNIAYSGLENWQNIKRTETKTQTNLSTIKEVHIADIKIMKKIYISTVYTVVYTNTVCLHTCAM